MIHYLGTSNTTFTSFVEDFVIKQEVKASNKSSEDNVVEILMAKKLFGKMHVLKIKKSKDPHDNLC